MPSVTINGVRYDLAGKLVTFDDLVKLADLTPSPRQPVITYLFDPFDRAGGQLRPGDKLPLTDGMVIKVGFDR